MKKLIIFFCILPSFIHAQHQATDSLDAFIAKQVINYKIPGLAIGIIKDNQIIFKKGYGVNSTIDSLPVTTKTIFPILSCTKAFTAAAIGILVKEGQINWNDKVIKYLPNFKLSDRWITKELTIADILSHRSGLESFEGDLLWYGSNYTRQEIVRRIQYSPIKNNFRAEYGYQNIMYLVAGLIIEKVTGHTWDDFIKDSLLLPLSMNNSSTSITQMIKNENYAHPHIRNKPISLINMDNIGPAGSINSTIDDMLIWIRFWIDAGAYNGKQILSQHAFQTITSPKIMLSEKSAESYGFGWNIGVENGKKVIEHGGGMPGFKSTISITPDNRTGIVILSNKISYFNDELMGIIMDYLDSKQINWKQADKSLYFKNFNFDWDQEPDTSIQLNFYIPNLSLYEGQYEDIAYGKAVIRKESGKAILELLPTKKLFTGRLYYVNTDTLKIIFNDAFIPAGEVVFKRGKDKQIKSFKLNISSSDFHFKYLNFKKIEN